MTSSEFSDQFDLLFNNITSNQAPGLTEYEKCVFLTKAEKEIVKNYFTANSKGNNLGQGFDDSAKRQADFSCLLKVDWCDVRNVGDDFDGDKIDDRSFIYSYPSDVFIIVNETIKTSSGKILQVIPLRYDEYTRLMSKPFKRPLKNQAWRLINSGIATGGTSLERYAEIILGVGETVAAEGYKVRYVRTPKPIIVADLDGLTIDGYVHTSQSIPSTRLKADGCELDPILHEDILQRAVELAKVAWTATGQDNTQAVMQAGQRTE